MNDERANFIKGHITAGKSYEEIKFELISQGYSTQGLADEYPALCKELGIQPAARQSAGSVTNPLSISSLVPDPTTGVVSLPGYFGMLQFGARLLVARFFVVLSAAIVIALVTAAGFFVPQSPTPYLFGVPYVVLQLLLHVLTVVIALLSNLAVVYALLYAEERATFMQGWSWALSKIGSLMWLWLLTLCILTASFAALVIPAVAFAIFNIFTLFVLAKDDLRGMDALIRSTDLVMGAFWGIVARMGVIFLASVPLIIIIGVIDTVVSSMSPAMMIIQLVLTVVLAFLSVFLQAFIVGSFLSVFHARIKTKSFFDASQYNGLRWAFWILFLVGFIILFGAAAIGAFAFTSVYDTYREQLNLQFDTDFSQFPSMLEDGGEQVDQFIVERRVDTMFAAGMVYYGRIQTFEGVCSDVVIEEPARCQSTVETFVIDAPIGDRQYYCRDSSGFKGLLTRPAPSALGCQ